MPRRQRPFKPPASTETQFGRALRKVGRISGHIVEAHNHNGHIEDMEQMQKALEDYSKLLGPWAKRQAAKMLEQVKKSNKRAYNNKARSIKEKLQLNVANSEIGRVASRLMDEQVELIKSLPIRAGLRAQQLAREAVYKGARAESIADIILELDRSGEVSEADATRIARTEVAKANAAITQARAQAIGAKAYIWRTTMDGAERHSHAEMNGEFVLYSQPPTLSDGTKGHAGTFINCRCYQDVQFDDNAAQDYIPDNE